MLKVKHLDDSDSNKERNVYMIINIDNRNNTQKTTVSEMTMQDALVTMSWVLIQGQDRCKAVLKNMFPKVKFIENIRI